MSSIITSFNDFNNKGFSSQQLCTYTPFEDSSSNQKIVNNEKYNKYVTEERHQSFNGSITGTGFFGTEAAHFDITLNTPGYVKMFFPYNDGGKSISALRLSLFYLSINGYNGDLNTDRPFYFFTKEPTGGTITCSDIINYGWRKIINPLYYDATYEQAMAWSSNSGESNYELNAVKWNEFFTFANILGNSDYNTVSGSWNLPMGRSAWYIFPIAANTEFKFSIYASKDSSGNNGYLNFGDYYAIFQVFAYEN